MRQLTLPTACAALLLAPAPTAAQTVTGIATVTDGDTIRIRDTKIRLWGIDAPESAQVCERQGQRYGCGREAANELAGLIAGKNVSCQQKGVDRYGRMVAVCYVGTTELNRLLVERGLALPYVQYGGAVYNDALASAQAARRGMHAGSYQLPWDYRRDPNTPPTAGTAKLTPQLKPVAAPKPTPAPAKPTNVYYKNCTAARAAGAAPLYRGEAGYRPATDRDNDGVACE